MHTTKPSDKKLAFLFLDEFIVGMGNVGSIWSAGSSMSFCIPARRNLP
jgi:hypothetical protein